MRRRTFLAVGTAGVGAAALAGVRMVGGDTPAPGRPAKAPAGTAAGTVGDAGAGGGSASPTTPRYTGGVPAVPAGELHVRTVVSPARHARPDLVTMLPHGVRERQARSLPVCVMLHPRGSSARGMVGLGMPRFLTQAVHAGTPPFALVAVDGGTDSYWHAIGRNDPQRMLLDELPGWLREAGLGLRENGVPRAALGISMGGYGALIHARRRRTLDVVAALSPALYRSWTAAREHGPFPDRSDWEGTEPLLHVDDLGVEPAGLGVWCGRQDPFHDAAREFATRSHAAVRKFAHGTHDPSYWRRIMPEVLHFVGHRLAGRS